MQDKKTYIYRILLFILDCFLFLLWGFLLGLLVEPVKGATVSGNNIYVDIPTKDYINEYLNSENNTSVLYDTYKGSYDEWAFTSGYMTADSYNMFVVNEYSVDEQGAILKNDLISTKVVLYPKFCAFFRDITMVNDVYNYYYECIPFCSPNDVLYLYNQNNHVYEFDLPYDLLTNISKTCVKQNIYNCGYQTDRYCYIEIEFDYNLLTFKTPVTKSVNALTGMSWDSRYNEILYSNEDIYYYEFVTLSSENNWTSLGTKALDIDEEMPLQYGANIQLKYDYSVSDEFDNPYIDEDIDISIDIGNKEEYEEITDADSIGETISKVAKNIYRAVINTFNAILEIPKTVVQGIYDYIGKPVRAIYALGVSSIDNFKAMLEECFVPQIDHIEKIKTAIDNQFPVIQDLQDFYDKIVEILNIEGDGNTPPEFNIAIDGKGYTDSVEVNILDLSWLTYDTRKFIKRFVSAILLWQFFNWCYKMIPKVLQGIG